MTKEKLPIGEGKDDKGGPNRLEVEEITKIVLDVISRWQSTSAKPADKFSRALNWMSTHWVIVLFFISVLSVLGASVLYKVSPLYPLKKIHYEQQESKHNEAQRELTKRMVGHQLALGKSFLDIGQHEAAKLEYREALKIDPTNPEAQMGLYKAGVYESIQGQYSPEVIEQRINLIRDVNSEDPHAYAFLGKLYASIDKDTAIKHYEKAKSLDPNVAVAYFGLSILYDKRGRLDETIEMLETATKLSKWNQNYLNNLAYFYAKNKQYPQAIETYKRVLQLDEPFLLTYYEIANVYRLMSNFEEAHLYQQALVNGLNDPEITALPKNKVAWYFEVGDEDIYFYDLLEKKYYAYYSFSVTLFMLGKEQEAERFMKMADDLEIDDQHQKSIKALVDFDLTRLREENPTLTNRIEVCRKKVLKY
ncbi:MAG: tetratricopeptide repeat protein [Planctomycetota bacterium]|jgi:tetratricopeptide (TPR) repeat protein